MSESEIIIHTKEIILDPLDEIKLNPKNRGMTIRCSYKNLVSIAELKTKFHPKNRNKHSDDQVKRLAEILKYQGIRYCAKLSNQSGYITSGHGRILAAEYNKWTHYPIDNQDYDNSEQEYADVQADNLIGLEAEIDLAGIQNDVLDLGPDFNVDMLGKLNFHIGPINFEPGDVEDQGQLDQKKPITCPNCGEEFVAKG